MGDEFKDANVDEPMAFRFEPITLNFAAIGVAQETLSTVFGFDGSKSEATHSVVIDTTETVSGAPPYPRISILDLPWWRIRERRRRIAVRERMLRDWERAYAAWVADGRPDREVVVRRYIPSARIVEED